MIKVYSREATLTKVHNFAKIYPEHVRLYKFSTPQLRQIDGFEPMQSPVHAPRVTGITIDNFLECSLKRTKRTIADLVLCNKFDMFATFTFDPKKVKDRLDPDCCKTVMQTWLSNQRKIHGKFDYLIVPEFHKKGGLHFHALLKNYNGKLTDSGKKKHGRKIYNIASYKSGFSTVVFVDHVGKVSSYVRKYITKDMPRFSNKKRYWCSTGLQRPLIDWNSGVADMPGVKQQILFANEGLTISNHDVTIVGAIKSKVKGAIQWLHNSV